MVSSRFPSLRPRSLRSSQLTSTSLTSSLSASRLLLPPPAMATSMSAAARTSGLIKQDLSKSLLVTQLLIDPVSRPPSHVSASPSDQYYVDVTAIKVNFAPLNFKASLLAIDKKGRGGTKISTLTQYTVLHSAIYRALVAEFSRQAAEKKIRRAEPIAPFGACFNARSLVAGPEVPAIVLVLRSDVQWRFEGGEFDVEGERGGDVPGVRGRVEAEDGDRDRGALDGGQSGGVRRGFDDV